MLRSIAFLTGFYLCLTSSAFANEPALVISVDGGLSWQGTAAYQRSLDVLSTTYEPDFGTAVRGRFSLEYAISQRYSVRANALYADQQEKFDESNSGVYGATLDLLYRIPMRGLILSPFVRSGLQWTTWSGVDFLYHEDAEWKPRDARWRAWVFGTGMRIAYPFTRRIALYSELTLEALRLDNIRISGKKQIPSHFDVEVSDWGTQMSATLLGVAIGIL